MMQNYFANHLSLVYLIYASSFLLLGFVIHLQATKSHFLQINTHLSWVKYFALLHAGKEFVDWYKVTYIKIAELEFIGNIFLILSFIALMEFGRRVFFDVCKRHCRWKGIIENYLTLFFLLLTLLITFTTQNIPYSFSISCRYFLGFPAGFLTAIAMLLSLKYDTKIKELHLTFSVKLAAFSFLAYGVISGVTVHENAMFPVLFSVESFKSVTGFSVQLFRAMAAISLLIAFSKIIKTVNNELKHELDATINHLSEKTAALQKEVNSRNISEKALFENQKILEYKNHIFELLFKSNDLNSILKSLIQSLEKAYPEMIVSILFLDEQKKHLIDGVTVSLPTHYMQAIDGLEIDEGVGSCGTAAFTKKPVIVDDINTHPFWQPFKALAQSVGLGACWSQPIVSSKQEVLGTFAIYYRHPQSPDESKLKLISELAQLTALIIENTQKTQQLKKLTVAIEQSPSSIIITDLDGNIEYVNPRFSEVTGYRSEEVLGKNPSLFQSGKTQKDTHDDLWATLMQGRVWRGEFINQRKNGESYWESSTIAPIRDEQGNIVNYVEIKEDITEQKQTKEKSNHLGRVLEDSLNEIYIFDNETLLFSQVNKGARDNLGYSMEELKKLTPIDIKPDYTTESFKQDLSPLYTKEEPFLLFKTHHKRKDGSLYPAEIHLQLVQAETSSVFVAIVQNISERNKAEALLKDAKTEAIQANLAKSQFLANMSHEIRTPMNAIINLVKLSLEEHDTEKQHYYLSQVVDSSELLLNIINDILDFSKIEAGKLVADKIPFNLFSLLNNLNNIFSLKAEEKGLSLDFIRDDSVPEFVIGDDLRLKQILINLIGNAIKFTQKGSVSVNIELIARSETNHALIKFSVNDTGIGIAIEKIPELFKAFIQAEDSTTRQFGGSGLGLAISQSLVKLLGGKLNAESSSGQGSCFYFQIPFQINTNPALNQEIEKIETINLSGKHLLVAEDNKTNRLVLKVILEQENISFEMAENGVEALEYLNNSRYDAVLMDVQMPMMNGIEATQKIRSSNEPYQNIPIIAMTAYAIEGDKEKCLESGMNAYVSKPIDRDVFLTTLSQQLSNYIQG